MDLKRPFYCAVEGPIGVGKTTLAQRLSEHFEAQLILEEFDQNPFLKEFYKDPRRVAFQVQMFFLIQRFQQQQSLHQSDLFQQVRISDYVFAKDRIFAHMNLNEHELKLYDAVAQLMERDIPQPDLIIVLQASVSRLLANIEKRGRPWEAEIKPTYLEDLNQRYNQYFFQMNRRPTLIVNTEKVDFERDGRAFEALLSEIEHHPGGMAYFNAEF